MISGFRLSSAKSKAIPFSKLIMENGRGGGTRTHDPRFWRPMLYQLSYTPALIPTRLDNQNGQVRAVYPTSAPRANEFTNKTRDQPRLDRQGQHQIMVKIPADLKFSGTNRDKALTPIKGDGLVILVIYPDQQPPGPLFAGMIDRSRQ
jgi:hypothetical protein